MILFIFFIFVFAIFQLKSLLLNPWYASHDGVFHLIRIKEFFYSLKQGIFPVRWAFHLDNNFGLPLFNYLYPGPYYFASLLRFLGFFEWQALKILIISAYFVGGLGIFFILKKRQKYLALFSAFLYLLVPYHFLNIFVRCALGEILAVAFMPWVWLSFLNLGKQKKIRWYHPLSLAALCLMHNFLAIFFSLFLLFYLLWQKKLKKQIFTSFLYSLGLASFFLMPMVLESRYLKSISLKQASYEYYDKAVAIKNLIYSPWGFGFSQNKSEEQMSFQLGLANIVIFVLSLIISLISKKQKKKLCFYILSFTTAVFLITPYSAFLIKILPFLNYSHFPYRFLFLTTFLTPLLAFEVFYFISKWSKKLAFLTAASLLILALYNTRNYKRPMLGISKKEIQQELIINQHLTTTTSRNEFLPKWVKKERDIREKIKASPPEVYYKILEEKPDKYLILAENPTKENVYLFLPKNYFPIWQLKIDGEKNKKNLSFSDDGRLKLKLLAGSHEYEIYLGQTRIEKAANLISLLSLGFLFKKKKQNWSKKSIKKALFTF